MNVLVVGGGGREHVLVWKLAQSPRVKQLFCAPGNAGTAQIARNLDVADGDIDGLLAVAEEHDIALTVVGPEAPLCAGIVDRFEAAGRKIFGPNKAAARIEGDKAYAKTLCRQNAIPTAEGRIFENFKAACDYVASRDEALVIKAVGLAAGKGVMVCKGPAEGLLALETIMKDRAFGEAGATVIVEERLQGPELSILALVDGRTIYVLETAQDHKPIGEGDTGPNTGGMGAYSPAPMATEEILVTVERDILVPIVDALRRDDAPYRGVLYAGLMLTAAGPKVLEFNCRFGDPETQPVLLRLQNDLLDVLLATCDGRLDEVRLDWDPRPAVCVVLASGGYPGTYAKGMAITGLTEAAALDDVEVFHAGTQRQDELVLTNGGRVLGVTALGADIGDAQRRAYQAVDKIRFNGATCRRDIAAKAL